jgi:DNA-binding transcriptional LysR family regulator
MDKLLCKQVFCQVVKEGSFTAAARKLNSSKVMVSRAVSQLEEDLAVRLLYRTTRKMNPTEEGLAYFERCQTLLEDFENLDTSLREKHQTAKGRLRISIPSDSFSINNLISPIFDFMQAYPEVEFDIHMGDRYVDLVDDGFDVVIRIGNLGDSSHIARKLDDMYLLVCATPEYLESHAQIKEPNDLNQHELLADTIYRSGRTWNFTKGNDSVLVKTNSRFKINSPSVIAEGVLKGLGVGMCPSFVVQEQLKSGQLVAVLQEWELMTGGVYAVYSHRRHLSAKVNIFVEFLIQHFRSKKDAT